MCTTSDFQMKIWALKSFFFWYMLLVGSPGYKFRWRLTLGWVLGVPLGSTLVESRGKKHDRVEGEFKLNHCPDDLSWPHGVSGWRWPLGVSWHIQWPGLYASTWWSLHVCGLQKGWWFKVAHWQHFQQLDNKSLQEGLNGTCPCLPPMCHSYRGRWLRCMYCGGMLLVTAVSQND